MRYYLIRRNIVEQLTFFMIQMIDKRYNKGSMLVGIKQDIDDYTRRIFGGI
jgi:hypothetical protein